MKEFEIWSEGYAATGERSGAHYYGKSTGNDFIEALENFRYPEDIIQEWTKEVIVKKGSPLGLDRNADGSLRLFGGKPASWACRYFDNEADARKSFG